MKLSDTFRKKALFRVVLAMPIEIEVEAENRDEAEDDARPHAFEMLKEMIEARDVGPRDLELTEMEIHPDLD